LAVSPGSLPSDTDYQPNSSHGHDHRHLLVLPQQCRLKHHYGHPYTSTEYVVCFYAAPDGTLWIALEAGMDAYVSKPIRTEELLRTIEGLSANDKPVLAAAPNAEASDEFDLENFTARIDNDEELGRELIELFFEDTPKLLSEIRNAMELGDAEKLE